VTLKAINSPLHVREFCRLLARGPDVLARGRANRETLEA
jgi:hypothetical protein